MDKNRSYIVFSTSNGTMAIYKDNIYLFAKNKFIKIIKIMNEDYLMREDNLNELLDYMVKESNMLRNQLEFKGKTEYCGVKITKILDRYDYYCFFINTLLGKVNKI